MDGNAAHGSDRGADHASDRGPDHGALMDSVYKGQRHIYDLTRKYYLFGRDTLIERLDAAPGSRVLEIACGTGRNLAKIDARWPGTRLYGLDISREMLKSAARTLGRSKGSGARLGEGDACAFDSVALFGEDAGVEQGVDRVVLSYSLSMIPDWRRALDQGAQVLARGGELHVVDFGDLAGLPRLFANALRGWLARFHVAARDDLPEAVRAVAEARGLSVRSRRGPLGYYQLHVLSAD